MKRVLAIDMGATSIRGIIGYIENNKLYIKEVMREKHHIKNEDGRMRWDFSFILNKIIETIIKEKKDLISIGVDSWGVDFGIINEDGNLIENPISYRDNRHKEGCMDFLNKVNREEIFFNTGNQIMDINTIFQLNALKNIKKEDFSNINKILFIPDLINYLLCGKMAMEETILSTSGFYNLEKKEISEYILDKLNISKNKFSSIIKSGEILGSLKNSKIKELNNIDVDVTSV